MALLSPAWTLLALLPPLLLLLGAEGSVGPSTNTSFCTESKECLEFQLVCKTDEYEVRHYSHTRWVSTDAEAFFMGVGAAMAFRRLFQYITGANEGGVQMEMTAPVLVKIPEETKMWEPAIYTLNFPLPAAYQDEPPAPTNDKLYFTDMPEMDVYVKSYGGWMLSVTSRLYAHMLTKELDRVRASYNHSYHYGVGYDSPLKLLNRHNEVWYVAEGPVVCTDPQEPTPAHPTRSSPTSWSAEPGPLPQALADSPSPLADSPSPLADSPSPLADSPSPLPSELSANTAAVDSWSGTPSAGPPASPSPVSTSIPSDMHNDDVAAFTPTSTPTPADPPSNSSEPVPVTLTPEAESGAPQWNSTAQSSVGADADSDPVVEPHGSD